MEDLRITVQTAERIKKFIALSRKRYELKHPNALSGLPESGLRYQDDSRILNDLLDFVVEVFPLSLDSHVNQVLEKAINTDRWYKLEKDWE